MQPKGMSCKFSLTRDRSKVSGEYEFNFVGNSQLAIVPILQLDKTGYRLVGTASYFIRPNIFITAGHIFKDDDLDAEKPFYILSNNFLDYPLEIIKIKKYEALDIAFLTIEKEGEQYFKEVNPLAVMNLPPEKHEIVAVFGFSHSILDPTDIIENNGEIFQKMQIRSKWEVGGVLDIHESGKGMVKGQCFETSILAEGGDSGAPMFNSNGFIVGLLSTSFEFSNGLPNSTCVTILELAETQFDGATIKNLWVKDPRAVVCRKKCRIS